MQAECYPAVPGADGVEHACVVAAVEGYAFELFGAAAAVAAGACAGGGGVSGWDGAGVGDAWFEVGVS